MHCAQRHLWRFGSRNHDRWNVATDYNINLQLKDAGLDLPPDGLVDEQYRHPITGDPLAAEVIYARLPADPEDLPDHTGTGTMTPPPGDDPTPGDEPGDEPGEGADSGDGPGDGPDGEAEAEGNSESDWDIAARAAESVCDKAGKMGAGAARAMSATRRTRNSWREEVEDFLQQTKPDGHTWQRPNRQLVHMGLHYPGVLKEDFPRSPS